MKAKQVIEKSQTKFGSLPDSFYHSLSATLIFLAVVILCVANYTNYNPFVVRNEDTSNKSMVAKPGKTEYLSAVSTQSSLESQYTSNKVEEFYANQQTLPDNSNPKLLAVIEKGKKIKEQLDNSRKKLFDMEQMLSSGERLAIINEEYGKKFSEISKLQSELDKTLKDMTIQKYHERKAKQLIIQDKIEKLQDLKNHREYLDKCITTVQEKSTNLNAIAPDWSINCVSSIKLKSNAGEKREVYGLYTPDEKIIYINYYGPGKAKITETIVDHEFAHAYSYSQWNPSQRRRFANALGYLLFNEGEYEKSPTEVFANHYYTICPKLILDKEKKYTDENKRICSYINQIESTGFNL